MFRGAYDQRNILARPLECVLTNATQLISGRERALAMPLSRTHLRVSH